MTWVALPYTCPILCGFNVDLEWFVGVYSGHFNYKVKEVNPQSTKGSIIGIKKVNIRDTSDIFANKPGAIMEVAMWLCTQKEGFWTNLGLVPNYVVFVPGNESCVSLHKEFLKYHWHKGDPKVTPRTCVAIGERAPVILMWIRASGVEIASHP